jgi:hypothetical protein
MMMIKAAGFKHFRRATLRHLLTWFMRQRHRKYYYKVIISLTTYAATTTMEA